VRVTPAESGTKAAAELAVSWEMPRGGSRSASARSSSASTLRFVAAGVADGLLAFGVGPAGPVGD
jgi:hypothetical protein